MHTGFPGINPAFTRQTRIPVTGILPFDDFQSLEFGYSKLDSGEIILNSVKQE
jgi:hypothetical protein